MHPTLITALTVEPLDLPLTEPFAIATGAQHVAHNALVRLTLADGTTGLGEAAPFTAVSGETQAGTLAALQSVRERLLGKDARAWRPLSEALSEALAGQPSARCALETALLDALARHHRVPLWVFFGGAGTALDIDMTVTAGDRAHAVASARAILARGITTLKVKVGATSPEQDVERLVAIREVAPQARLFADANGGYTEAQARAFLTGLERAQVPLALFEQPVPPEDFEGLAALTRASRIPICADESARSAQDVLRLVRERAAHGINIKTMKCGVVESLTMWHLARAAGLELMIGGMVESVLSMSLSAHLATGLGSFHYADLDTPLFIARHPFRGGYQLEGAQVSIASARAGHGVELT
ncbi:dipeptide epimerase [Stigmatella aurantiaca]|uniref:Dipeptide epimerase n=1 Tax=Stigmatella aurantiaca (strain DW4/3-1) TaxID=378806 RepID=Q08S37_STIAD|nr:dipeptide epimerase [Stigmatella aurantiaca]ADO76010.1 Mandelate racemase/muconate lactonizing enzyme family protein [Stigmatella aurantiaca DW4/3-1]EAU63303.1 mandelate racemase / muconate lactonizing enzyme, N-terminal domain protein [Stigmatella aurantiaca DW4/3-1]